MYLDEEMKQIETSLPETWWDVSTLLAEPSPEVNEARQRLLLQTFFFLVRMYMHLPSLLRPHTASHCETSKIICMKSSRELVRRYHMLRSEVDGRYLFECKTNDFVGFTAAIILVIGLFSRARASPVHSYPELEEDWYLACTSKALFQRLTRESGCQLAFHCHRALDLLLKRRNSNTDSVDRSDASTRIFIPYFGTVSVKGGVDIPWPASFNASTGSIPTGTIHGTNNIRGPPVTNSLAADMTPEISGASEYPTFRYDGPYTCDSTLDRMSWVERSEASFASGGGAFVHPNASSMDIGEDWTWILENMDEHTYEYPGEFVNI
jgi:hypothetical protein